MPRAACIAFTRQGCDLALRIARELPAYGAPAGWECSVHGPARFAAEAGAMPFENLDAWTAAHFTTDDALVFVGAAGIAVRAIAPHVKDKFADPAVVSVDESGSFIVPLLSGHVGGANDLARAIAGITGGQAAISTATDVNGLFAVDEWARKQGLSIVERDRAKRVSATLLEDAPVGVAGDSPWKEELLSAGLTSGPADVGVFVSGDVEAEPFPCTLHLVPRTITVGVGCRKGADPAVLAQAVDAALAQAGATSYEVAALSTIDVKRGERAICQLADERGWDLRFYSAEELSQVPGTFAESAFVQSTVGVGNVCERAACAQGWPLLLGKQASDGVTVALSAAPTRQFSAFGNGGAQTRAVGKLSVVGLGPGGSDDMSGRARAAVAESDLVVGYTVYVDLLRPDFPDKEFYTTPMRKEVDRCRYALSQAVEGRTVALVCSGDPGIYGMAGLVFELAAEFPPVAIEVVPGISASNGGAAVLGAPLMHDHCIISLSDLLTPWETIERRLIAAAQADFAICLYNPSSHKRPGHLRRACDILLAHRSPETVCGIVRYIGRAGQEERVLTLGELRDTPVDMFTTVFIGNSQTKDIDGRMVTPRGYLQREGL